MNLSQEGFPPVCIELTALCSLDPGPCSSVALSPACAAPLCIWQRRCYVAILVYNPLEAFGRMRCSTIRLNLQAVQACRSLKLRLVTLRGAPDLCFQHTQSPSHIIEIGLHACRLWV